MLYFFFKQKTAYEMRISDWSSDVCSSDLMDDQPRGLVDHDQMLVLEHHVERDRLRLVMRGRRLGHVDRETLARDRLARRIAHRDAIDPQHQPARYQRLDALARQVGQRLGQRPIETPAIGGPGDLGVDDGNTPVHALERWE